MGEVITHSIDIKWLFEQFREHMCRKDFALTLLEKTPGNQQISNKSEYRGETIISYFRLIKPRVKEE